jgi:hypothetical protein
MKKSNKLLIGLCFFPTLVSAEFMDAKWAESILKVNQNSALKL